MSKSKVNQFCEAYRKFFKDPAVHIGSASNLISMLEKMSPKKVDGAYRILEREKIEIGAVQGPIKNQPPELTAVLHRMSLLAGKRWQKGQQGKRKQRTFIIK